VKLNGEQMPDKNIELIVGDRIQLRPLEKGDLENRVRWFNDPEVSENLILDEKLNLEKTIKWFDCAQKDESRRDFVIETVDKQPIGFVGFRKISKENRSACVYIVIGKKSYWGKGIGTEALSILIQWGFFELALNKIWSTVKFTNTVSLALLKKVGFNEEGLLREEEILSGQKIDIVRVGLLCDEFYEKHPEFKEKS
jgi:RimJ/RimL family protein N-acetyltransferase